MYSRIPIHLDVSAYFIPQVPYIHVTDCTAELSTISLQSKKVLRSLSPDISESSQFYSSITTRVLKACFCLTFSDFLSYLAIQNFGARVTLRSCTMVKRPCRML